MKSVYCCIALALGVAPGVLGAQESPALAPGTRIRVLAPKPACTYPETWPCYHKVVGTLDSVDNSTIIMHDEYGWVVSVPRVPGTRLDVSAGQARASTAAPASASPSWAV